MRQGFFPAGFFPASYLPSGFYPDPSPVVASGASAGVPGSGWLDLCLGLADPNAAREIVAAIRTLASGQPAAPTVALIRMLIPGAALPDPYPGSGQPATVAVTAATAKALAVAMGDIGAARGIVAAIRSGGSTLPSERAIGLFRLILR